MSSATLDRLLAALIAGLALTGLVSLVSGAPGAAWLFVLHDLLAGALAAAVLVKLARSVPRAIRARRWPQLAVAAAVTLVAAVSLGAAFAWVASGTITWVDVGPLRWTLLTLHAAAGIALLPLLVVHLSPRRWRLLRVRRVAVARNADRLISRRSLLVGAAYAFTAVVLVGAAAASDTLRGGARRFTGSRFLPQGPPGVPTTFLGEPTPVIDIAAWRLRVTGRVERELELDLGALARRRQQNLTAVLDCTSGWAVEATWAGVTLAALLDEAGAARDATRVDIVAVTGWRASLPIAEARASLLATAEGGAPLVAEHGAPLRLVAPDHRGLEWVKWVDRIEVG